MSIKPKHTLQGELKTIRRLKEFTDREYPIKIFTENLKNLDSNNYSILVYYGIGGIGKTTLRKELCSILEQNSENTIWAVVDFDHPAHRDQETALFLLRKEFSRKYKIKFNSFDLAYSFYWKKTHPHQPFNKETFRLLEESEVLGEIVGVISQINIIGIIPKIGKLLLISKRHLKNWWIKRGQKELAELPDLEPKEILERLPMYLAADLKESLTDKKCVIFLDTYEALWENRYNTGSFFMTDEWVRELTAHLPEPLWVIFGREKLKWFEINKEWNEYVKQYDITNFERSDCETFLEKCGIVNKQIQDVIISASEGVPYYLDLAVDTYYEIKNNLNRIPEKSDFAEAQHKVSSRFLKYLDINTTETLKLLSVPRFWNKEIFKLLVSEFKTGYPQTAFSRLTSYSFVNDKETKGVYTLHSLMKESIAMEMSRETTDEINEVMFNYYYSQLQKSLTKNPDVNAGEFLSEAYYHCSTYMPPDQIWTWLEKILNNKDYIYFLYKTLIPVIEDILSKSEHESIKYSTIIYNCFLKLHFCYKINNDYKKALLMLDRAIETAIENFGEYSIEHSDALEIKAEFVFITDKMEKSLDIYKRSLNILSKLSESLFNEKVLSKIIGISRIYRLQGKFSDAKENLRNVLHFLDTKNISNDFIRARILNELGTIYMDEKKLAAAENILTKSYELYNDSSDLKNQSVLLDTLLALGNIKLRLHKFTEAEHFLNECLNELKRKDINKSFFYSFIYRELGNLYYHKKEYENAEKWYFMAIENGLMYTEENNSLIGFLYSELAQTKLNKDKYEEAENLYKKSMEILSKCFSEEYYFLSVLECQMGIIKFKTKKFEEADEFINKGITSLIKTQGENTPEVGMYYYYLGLINLNKRKIIEAISFFDKSYSILSMCGGNLTAEAEEAINLVEEFELSCIEEEVLEKTNAVKNKFKQLI